MITRVGMAPRRAGTSISEFQHHWRGAHADAALHIPNLRGYVQNHAVLDGRRRPLFPYPGFDACAETEFDDLTSMDSGFASPAYQTDVRADEELLIDKSRFFFLLCSRIEVMGGATAPDTVKLMTFMRAHPLVSRQGFLDVVCGIRYGDLVQAAGALRHEQLVPDPDLHQGRQPAKCDLVDCIWFASSEQALEFVNGAAGDEAAMLLSGNVFGRERLLATAHVIRSRRSTADH